MRSDVMSEEGDGSAVAPAEVPGSSSALPVPGEPALLRRYTEDVAAVSNRDDDGRVVVSDDALAWAYRWFPDRDPQACLELHALVASHADERIDAETEAMQMKRAWRGAIRDVVLTNGAAQGDFFVTFSLPYNHVLQKKYRRPRKHGAHSSDATRSATPTFAGLEKYQSTGDVEQGEVGSDDGGSSDDDGSDDSGSIKARCRRCFPDPRSASDEPQERKSYWMASGNVGYQWSTACVRNMLPEERHEFRRDSTTFELGATRFSERCNPRGNLPYPSPTNVAGWAPLHSLSYFDLVETSLCVELWCPSRLGTNQRVAATEVPLIDIVMGRMSRTVTLESAADPLARVPAVVHGTVDFTLLLHESTDVRLDIKHWRAELDACCLAAEISPMAESVRLIPTLRLHLMSANPRVAPWWFANSTGGPQRKIDIVGHAITFCRRPEQRLSPQKLSLRFSVDETMASMPFRGTALDLEDAVLKIEIFLALETDQKWLQTIAMQFLAAHTTIPLKGAMGLGSVTAQVGFDCHFGRRMEKGCCGLRRVEMPEFRKAGFVTGDLTVTALPKAIDDLFGISKEHERRATRLWHAHQQNGASRSPRLFDHLGRSYLCVNVRSLSLTDMALQKLRGRGKGESPCPVVVGEWAGQSFETGSLGKQVSLHYEVDEAFAFHIRCYSRYPTRGEVESMPIALLRVWHEDENGERLILGTAKLYLHSITGRNAERHSIATAHSLCSTADPPCVDRSFERVEITKSRAPFAEWRERYHHRHADRRQATADGVGRAGALRRCSDTLSEAFDIVRCGVGIDPLETQVKMARVFRGGLRIMDSSNEMIGEIQVEAYFRCPTSQRHRELISGIEIMCLYDYELSHWMDLSHYDERVEEEERKLCVCEHVWPCDEARRGAVCSTIAEFGAQVTGFMKAGYSEEFGLASQYDALGDEEVPCDGVGGSSPAVARERGRDKDAMHVHYWSHLVCIDENGTPQFYPSFLRATAVPEELIRLEAENLLSFQANATDYVMYPQVAHALMDFVRQIPFAFEAGFGSHIEAGSVEDQRLRNYQLALRAASPSFFLARRNGDVRDHAMLLCNLLLGAGMDAYICIGEATVEVPEHRRPRFGEGSRRRKHFVGNSEVDRHSEHVWVMTRETVMTCPPTVLHEEDKAVLYGHVRFWEVSTGNSFLLKRRWRPPLKIEHQRSGERARHSESGEEENDDVVLDGTYTVDKSRCLEDQVMTFVDGARLAECVEDAIFLEKGSEGDRWGAKTEEMLMNEFHHERRGRRERETVDANRKKLEAQKMAKQDSESKRLADSIASHRKLDPIVPYLHIHVVFNQKNLWVNCQRDSSLSRLDDPMLVHYDLPSFDVEPMQRAVDTGWVSFRSDDPSRGSAISSHDKPITLKRTMTPEATVRREMLITEDLETQLESMRQTAYKVDNHQATATKVVAQLRTLLTLALVAKEELSRLYPGERPQVSAKTKPVEEWGEGEMRDAYDATYHPRALEQQSTKHLKRMLRYYQSMNDLRKTVPPAFTARVMFFHLNTLDMVEIRRAVLDRAFNIRKPLLPELERDLERKLYLLGANTKEVETFGNSQMFAIATKVFPSFNGGVTVRIAVMFVCKAK